MERLALLGNPGPHVGDGKLQVLAEPVCRRSRAVDAPALNRRDRNPKAGGQLADVHHGPQSPRLGDAATGNEEEGVFSFVFMPYGCNEPGRW